MSSFGMSRFGATNSLSKSGSGAREHNAAYPGHSQLLRPASHIRSLGPRVCARAFVPAVHAKAPVLHSSDKFTGGLND